VSTSVPLLIVAAGSVGFLHSILPDHWVPLAIVGRTQRWSITRVARISFLASIGHVVTSLIIAGIIAVVGLQFRHTFETQQGHIVGVILMLTGIGFLIWAITGHGGHAHGPDGHTHSHGTGQDHDHEHDHHHGHEHDAQPAHGSLVQRFAAIAGPFGAAASPDLTILPVALAASAIGIGAVVGCLVSFTIATIGTFVILTVAATLAGYQVKGEWLEEHGTAITAVVLLVIGVAVYIGL
jgi:ABC-type nickel/cobalt efflux system permease component RcnA